MQETAGNSSLQNGIADNRLCSVVLRLPLSKSLPDPTLEFSLSLLTASFLFNSIRLRFTGSTLYGRFCLFLKLISHCRSLLLHLPSSILSIPLLLLCAFFLQVAFSSIGSLTLCDHAVFASSHLLLLPVSRFLILIDVPTLQGSESDSRILVSVSFAFESSRFARTVPTIFISRLFLSHLWHLTFPRLSHTGKCLCSLSHPRLLCTALIF